MHVKDTILKIVQESMEAKIVASVDAPVVEAVVEAETVVVVEDATVVEATDTPVVEAEAIVEAKDKENEKFNDKMDGDEDDDMCEAVDESILAEAMAHATEALTEDEKAKLLEGIELPEEVKASVLAVFEAAVAVRAKGKIEEACKKTAMSYSKKLKENSELLEKKSKATMKDVAKKWMNENKVALETGIRLHLAESFMEDLKGLFEKHYLDVPAEKTNLIEALQVKIEKLEEKYTEKAIELETLKEAQEFKAREKLLVECTADLSDIQVEKVQKLMEGLTFAKTEEFKAKLDQIKESVVAVKEEAKVITEGATQEAPKTKVNEISELHKLMKAYR